MLLSHTPSVRTASVPQADIDTLVSSGLVATSLMFKAVLVHHAVIGHLAACAVINIAWMALADGFVVLSKTDRVLATGLVFTNISALFDSLGAKLALITLSTVFVFQAFMLWFGCAAANKVVGITIIGILANTVCSVANGMAYCVRAALSVDADILAFACVVLADHTSRVRIASVICFTDGSSSWWCAADFQVTGVALESLYALANTDPVLHCTGCIWSTNPVFAGTDAMPPVVNSRHANTERPAVVISVADNRWDWRSEGRDRNGRLSTRRKYWRWRHIAAPPSRYHNIRAPWSASKQRISNHSIWADAFEASESVDAASVGAANTARTQAFIDVITSCEGISLQSCWAAAFHSVARFVTVSVTPAGGGSAAWLVLCAACVWISKESGVADALVGYGIHAVRSNSTSWSACGRQYRWNTHGFRVAQEVRQADAVASLFVTACSDATLNVLTTIYAVAINTFLALGTWPGF